MSKSNYEEETDTFLRRLRDGEFVFTSKATEVRYVYNRSESDGPLQLRMKYIPLSDCLNNAIYSYCHVLQDVERRKWAKECHDWIQLAWLNGAIQESQGLTKKVEVLRSENAELRGKMEELSEKYLEAVAKIEKYENDLPFLKKGRQ